MYFYFCTKRVSIEHCRTFFLYFQSFSYASKVLYFTILGDVNIDNEDEANEDNTELENEEEDAPSQPEKAMLIDLIGNNDNAESDPLVHLDGVEEKPDEVLDEQMDG